MGVSVGGGGKQLRKLGVRHRGGKHQARRPLGACWTAAGRSGPRAAAPWFARAEAEAAPRQAAGAARPGPCPGSTPGRDRPGHAMRALRPHCVARSADFGAGTAAAFRDRFAPWRPWRRQICVAAALPLLP